MHTTKIGSIRLGKLKPFNSITRAMTSALENRYANRPIRVAKLGDAFYHYFTQPVILPYASRLHWQDDLAEHLCRALNFKSIHPGDVDSHGWMSVVAINATHTFTTSLIRESLDSQYPLETLITLNPIGKRYEPIEQSHHVNI